MNPWRTTILTCAALLTLGGLGAVGAAPADAGSKAGATLVSKRLLKSSTVVKTGLSGAYLGSNDPAAYAKFGAWRGRPVTVAVTYAPRQTWNDIMNPQWVLNSYKNSSLDVSLAESPVPLGDSAATMQKCANGEYRSQWTTFGKNVAASGMQNRLIVRLGWEFNGDWNTWSAFNPSTFATCWQQIVLAARQYAPQVRWDWNPNRGAGQSVKDARNAWPGDWFVDIVGVDSFDWWPAVTSAQAWEQQVDGPFGLSFWLSFAIEHGKKFSVPEWGLYSSSPNSGGDNPYYIQGMLKFLKAAGPNLAYEAYFNDAPGTQGALYAPNQNPRAATAYRTP